MRSFQNLNLRSSHPLTTKTAMTRDSWAASSLKPPPNAAFPLSNKEEIPSLLHDKKISLSHFLFSLALALFKEP